MPHFSLAQQRARQHVIALAGRAMPAGQFGPRLLAVLQQAIPADGMTLFGVDPTTLLFNRVLAMSASMRPHLAWFWQHSYLAEPVVELTHPALMRARQVALAFDARLELSQGLPPALLNRLSADAYARAYAAFEAPQGGILRAFFSAGGQTVAALDLVRFGPGRPFQAADVAYIRVLAPMIGRALQSALAYEEALGSTADAADLLLQRAGALMLGPTGQVQLCTPAGEAWLAVLRRDDDTTCGQLPTVILSAVASLRACTSASPVSLPDMPRVLTRAGPVCVEAALSDTERVIVITLVPNRPPARPTIPAAWPVTKQERAVLDLLLQGLANRHIAARLTVSEHTVERHLAHIYEKLGVHSRMDVFARLFDETYRARVDMPEGAPGSM